MCSKRCSCNTCVSFVASTQQPRSGTHINYRQRHQQLLSGFSHQLCDVMAEDACAAPRKWKREAHSALGALFTLLGHVYCPLPYLSATSLPHLVEDIREIDSALVRGAFGDEGGSVCFSLSFFMVSLFTSLVCASASVCIFAHDLIGVTDYLIQLVESRLSFFTLLVQLQRGVEYMCNCNLVGVLASLEYLQRVAVDWRAPNIQSLYQSGLLIASMCFSRTPSSPPSWCMRVCVWLLFVFHSIYLALC